MNVNSVKTKDYENKRLSRPRKNKPNSNPILVRQLVHRSFSEDGSLWRSRFTHYKFYLQITDASIVSPGELRLAKDKTYSI